MGDQVGRLIYGAKISESAAEKLTEKYKAEYFSCVELEGGIEVDTPYETEEYFIKIGAKEANFAAYNESSFLGKDLPETSPNWLDKIEYFCKENDIEYDIKHIGWYLLGHYN